MAPNKGCFNKTIYAKIVSFLKRCVIYSANIGHVKIIHYMYKIMDRILSQIV